MTIGQSIRRTITRIFAIIGFAVVALCLLALAGGAITKRENALPDRMVLTMALDGDLPETAPEEASILDAFGGPPPMTLFEAIRTLDNARQDARVAGLVARIDSNNIGLASMQELRGALQRFERSGKFAYAYIDDLGSGPAMGEYWLATAFDQIWLHPIGSLALTGFSAELPFAKTMLDRIGVEAELLHQGKYKSFPESFTRSTASAENRENATAMLKSISDSFYDDVSRARKLDRPRLAGFIEQALIPAETALAEGLIDSIGYRDEFDGFVEQSTKGAAPVPIERYRSNGARPAPGAVMALVNVHGPLTNVPADEAITSNVVSAEMISSAVIAAAENDAIKAIVMRVDSPGGTPLAADTIRRAVVLAKQRKPVVVTMSNAAASGGYWMSAPANAIIAQPTTLTGSIGVFGGKANAEDLLKKIGVTMETVTDGTDNSDMWSVSKPYGPQSRARIEAMMAKTYDQFIARVAEGRKMSPADVEKIAQGRVWTGAEAVQIGLVDKLGGIDTAVATAKTLAKIPERSNVNLEIFPKNPSKVDQVMRLVNEGVPSPFSASLVRQQFKIMLRDFLPSSGLPTSVMH